MNTKSYAITSLVVFLYLFLINFLFHGLIMNSAYEPLLGSLLRAEGESGAFFVWMSVGYVVLGFLLCYVFVRGYEGRGIGEGVRFGLIVGALLSIPTRLIHYAVQPWPANIIISWIIGDLVIYIIAGVLMAMIYRPEEA